MGAYGETRYVSRDGDGLIAVVGLPEHENRGRAMTVLSGAGLTRFLCCAGSMLLFVSLLSGCGPEPQAPSPTVNPHPHEFTKLKITVEPGSGVTGVKVESLWTVGNISCAPHESWPSGASITKQVNTPEKVDKTGADEWIATVVDDRFLPDKCQWRGGGVWHTLHAQWRRPGIRRFRKK